MKEHRNCAVRAKEKNWEEKVKKKCCIKKCIIWIYLYC